MSGFTQGLRQVVAFGTGAGIQVTAQNLEIAVVRVRPTAIQVIGRLTIPHFRERPAAQWGAEYAAFLQRLGTGRLSATVLLPRHEAIGRHIAMRGVENKDLEAAIAFQLDALNPYGEDEVLTGWTPLGEGNVLVGIARREVVERYLELFGAAGIACAAFTFASAAIHGAIRLGPPPPPAFLAISRTEDTVEVYGESPARPVFSAEFEPPEERAAALAAAELRLDADTQPLHLENLLPPPRLNPVENDLARNPLPYAAALAGACPRLAPVANLLPPERRASNSRAMYIPTAVCACLLLLTLAASLAFPSFDQSRYLKSLQAQIASVEPQARHAAALDRQIDRMRGRARLLDEFRARTRADLEALNELTHLLPPPVWTNVVELSPDGAMIAGEAEQAAPLLKLVDGSPLFHNSEFSSISKVGTEELFRLRTQRRPGQ